MKMNAPCRLLPLLLAMWMVAAVCGITAVLLMVRGPASSALFMAGLAAITGLCACLLSGLGVRLPQQFSADPRIPPYKHEIPLPRRLPGSSEEWNPSAGRRLPTGRGLELGLKK